MSRLWRAFDDLDLALRVCGVKVSRADAEGFLMRLGMCWRYWHDRAEEERKRGR